jgi:cytochrome b pre-mRNA-processing protein 3
MAIWPFRRSQAELDAARLLAAVTEVSRKPAFFGAGKVADTLQGRFELMTLNASLAMIRLRADAGAAPLAQAFADQLFRQFDAGLREEGVGDTSVPKRMHRMAGDFYGRLDAYAAAIGADDAEGLAAALGRNALAADANGYAPSLARYALAAAQQQALGPVQALLSVEGWPAPPD